MCIVFIFVLFISWCCFKKWIYSGFGLVLVLMCLNCSYLPASAVRLKRDNIIDDGVQSYLTKFGYMEKSADGAFALRTEESIRSAIKDLQQFAGLPPTGKIDSKTKKLLSTPRCGLPDKKIYQTSGRRKRYSIQGQKWPFTDLTWRLNRRNLGNLDPYEVRLVISKALEVWSRHSKLTFKERDDDKADIQIHFYRGDHGDNFAFDGKGVVLAHAFFPNNGRSIDVHFDADETWITSGSNEQGTNLFNVAAHEIGHSLGLSHSDQSDALMYPWYKEIENGFDYELPEDDRLAIQYLYGAKVDRQWERIKPYFPPRTTTTTTTTTPRPPPRTHPRGPRPGYDPRYPHGHHPYTPAPRRPEKHYPHNKQPMHPDKKPHYPKNGGYPYKPDRKHPHHRHPEREPETPRYYPTRPTKSPDKDPYKPRLDWKPRYPVKESPVQKPAPDTCDTNYDAVAVIRREVFIFKDAYFWRINDNGLLPNYPAEINRFWQGLPVNLTHVDAVYERPDPNRSIVFFVGKYYYVLNGTKVEYGPRPITDLGLPETLLKIDGAMVWGHNGKTYFYSGNMYWRFDEDVQKVELDYPRNMAMWKGVGTDVDAVFQWKDGRTYFFKDKIFWKFNDLHMRIEHGYPKPSAPFWMGCTNNIEENDVGEKMPYRGDETSSTTTLTSSLQNTFIFGIILITKQFFFIT